MARVQTAHHPPRGSTPTHGSSSLRASMPGSVFPVFSATQKRATPRRTARVNEHHTRFVIMPWMGSCTPKECGRIRAIAAAMLCVFCDHSPVMIGWPSRVKKYHAYYSLRRRTQQCTCGRQRVPSSCRHYAEECTYSCCACCAVGVFAITTAYWVGAQ